MLTPRITVPARKMNALARSIRRRPSDFHFGQRYGGNSMMNATSRLRSTELFKALAVDHGHGKAKHIQTQHGDRAGSHHRSQHRTVGDERRNHHGVNRQPRRTGHERCDQNGGDAVALVLDRARRHDGRNGASVGGKQRDERLSVQADLCHHLVGDHRGSRQVAGIFQNADDEEEKQNLRQKDQHRSGALPDSVDHQRIDQAGGEQVGEMNRDAVQQLLQQVAGRLAQRENGLEDGDDDDRERSLRPRVCGGRSNPGGGSTPELRRAGRRHGNPFALPIRGSVADLRRSVAPAARATCGVATRKFATACRPSPVTALTSATGVPSCRARGSTSTCPPCLCSSSAMLSRTSVGSPRAMTRPASTRCRLRLLESSTRMMASGRSAPGISPFSTSTVTFSSSDFGLRL